MNSIFDKNNVINKALYDKVKSLTDENKQINTQSEKSSSNVSRRKSFMDNGKTNFTKNFSNLLKIQQPTEKSVFEHDSFDKIIGGDKGSFKEMVENASIDQKVLNLISDTLELFEDKKHDSDIIKVVEEKEKYELVEKIELEKLKMVNESLKAEKSRLTYENEELTKEFGKTKGNLNLLTQSFNNQQKNRSEYMNKIYKLEDKLRENILANNKVKEMINKERTEKDNIFRALVTLTKKNDYKIPNQLKEIYQKFNNDYFNSAINTNNSDKIELLKARVDYLMSILQVKKEEIQNKKSKAIEL